MASGNLVPVGHVFAVFPAHNEHDIILGIAVESNGFGTKNELVIFNPEKPGEPLTIRVHTLEHERKRTNVAQPGKEYGVKPFRVGSETLTVNPTDWLVYALEHQSRGAAQRTPRTWNRPPRPTRKVSFCQVK
ncbi:MAG: hypothetical protein HZC01_01675 [Candidatus Kerfeldbacteria bacterium]|nr:hypothetical protein [Candidatus Kerfeldbacteria bacterium]